MHIFLVLAQLAAASPPPARSTVSPSDSAALIKRVEEAEFRFLMDWRYIWQKEIKLFKLANRESKMAPPAHFDPRYELRNPTGPFGPTGCNYLATARFDIDRHEWMAHLIKAPNRIQLSLCPIWSPPNWYEPADERKSIDAALTMEGFPPIASDSVRLLRARVLKQLDAAAKQLPGDGWIAGQRVRLHLDQAETGAARKAALECRAAAWWCTALTGYVQFAAGEASSASVTFDRARKAMADSVRCVWDDVGLFFDYHERRAYESLTCAARDTVNARVWWLADPLYLENGNERRTEHYARRVLIALRGALDADEYFDWRENYQGPALTEMILRYGWPTKLVTFENRPVRWVQGNTRAIYIGDSSVYPPFACPGPNCWVRPGIEYWGPQFHTVPLWKTVADPFHATDDGWDLAAPRDGGPYWDTSWWPLEFYRRDNGPLVPLSTQVAFFRRQTAAVLAAGMEWDTVAYLARPLDRMVGAAIVTTGPTAISVVRDTMSGRTPRPIVAAVASGPALLSVEMVPRESSGPAARTRFGIHAPAPLRDLGRGELGLSDVVLARAREGEDAPPTFVAMLPRMLGSTLLRDPKRTALFWELYGLATGDTVNVALRIVRKDDPNALRRLGALVGVGRTGDDSLVVRWTEPRPGEPTATVEGGVTIRPRGLVIDMSGLTSGRYSLEISVQRAAAAPVVSRREFRIDRR